MKDSFKKLNNVIIPVSVAAAMIIGCFIVAKIIGISLIMPTPAETFLQLGSLMSNEVFWKSVFGTVWRSLKSFFLAFIFSSILSIIASRSRLFERILDPIVSIFRSVPTMSVILISILWIGSKNSPMFISFLITFPMLYQAFLTALSGVDKGLIEMSKVYNVSKKDTIFKLYIPSSLPAVFGSVKSVISLSLKTTIAAEVMSQTHLSIGVYMQQAMAYFEMPNLFAWTLVAIVFSYLLELIVVGLNKLFVRW
jgi:NitT/TauT family transport system permease protein